MKARKSSWYSLTYNSWGRNPKDLALFWEELLKGKRRFHSSSSPGSLMVTTLLQINEIF